MCFLISCPPLSWWFGGEGALPLHRGVHIGLQRLSKVQIRFPLNRWAVHAVDVLLFGWQLLLTKSCILEFLYVFAELQAVLLPSSHSWWLLAAWWLAHLYFQPVLFPSGMISQALRQLLCMRCGANKVGDLFGVFLDCSVLPPSIRPAKHVTPFRPFKCFYPFAETLQPQSLPSAWLLYIHFLIGCLECCFVFQNWIDYTGSCGSGQSGTGRASEDELQLPVFLPPLP